jgi:hypothetical protein
MRKNNGEIGEPISKVVRIQESGFRINPDLPVRTRRQV